MPTAPAQLAVAAGVGPHDGRSYGQVIEYIESTYLLSRPRSASSRLTKHTKTGCSLRLTPRRQTMTRPSRTSLSRDARRPASALRDRSSRPALDRRLWTRSTSPLTRLCSTTPSTQTLARFTLAISIGSQWSFTRYLATRRTRAKSSSFGAMPTHAVSLALLSERGNEC